MDKELFDRDINETPAMNRRIAHGLPGELAENSTFQQVKDLFADEDGTWNSSTLGTNWVGTDIYTNSRPGFWYRLNKIGQLEISISVYHNASTPFNGIITTLPVNYRPAYGRSFNILLHNGYADIFYKLHIKANGEVNIYPLFTTATIFPVYVSENLIITLT